MEDDFKMPQSELDALVEIIKREKPPLSYSPHKEDEEGIRPTDIPPI